MIKVEDRLIVALVLPMDCPDGGIVHKPKCTMRLLNRTTVDLNASLTVAPPFHHEAEIECRYSSPTALCDRARTGHVPWTQDAPPDPEGI